MVRYGTILVILLSLASLVIAQSVMGPVGNGQYGRRKPTISDTTSPEPFIYWTNPVPVRLWYDGVTNISGNARDASANNLDGIIVGATQAVVGINTDGKTNWGFYFDHIDDVITNPAAFLLSATTPYGDYTNYEMCAWVFVTGTNLLLQDILSRGGVNASEQVDLNIKYATYGPTNSPLADNYNVAVTNGVSGFATGTWQHISFVRHDFSHISVFTNGEYSISNKTLNSPLTTAVWSNLWVGVRAHDNNWHFGGYMDDIMIYSQTNLTYAERKALVTNSIPTNSHLQIIPPDWIDPYNKFAWFVFQNDSTNSLGNEVDKQFGWIATNVNNATLVVAGTNALGKVKYARLYDGSTQHHVWNRPADYIVPPTTQFTFVAWVKSYTNTQNAYAGIAVGQTQGYGLLSDSAGKGYYAAVPTTAITNNTMTPAWQHLCGVYDGSKSLLYIDGVLKVTGAAASGSKSDYYQLFIGLYNSTTPARRWNGLIGYVGIYTNAFTPENVTNHFNGTSMPNGCMEVGY